MKFAKLAVTCLCTLIIFCACAKNPNVVMKVNDKEITRSEFYSDYNKIKNSQLRNAPSQVKKDSSYASLSIKNRYINDVIARTLLEEEFESDEKLWDVIQRREKIVEQIGSEERFKNILKQNKISDKKLHADLASEVKMEKLVEMLVKDDPVKDSDALKFYNQNKRRFEAPELQKIYKMRMESWKK